MKRAVLLLAAALLLAAMTWLLEDATDRPLFPAFDPSAVVRIEYTHPIGGVQLVREEGGERSVWRVAVSIPDLQREPSEREGRTLPEIAWRLADRRRVNAVLNALYDLPAGVIVSANVEKQALYLPAGQAGEHVRCFDDEGRVVIDLFLGKHGPDLASTYVRLAGSDEVRLVGVPLGGLFSAEVADWELQGTPPHDADHQDQQHHRAADSPS